MKFRLLLLFFLLPQFCFGYYVHRPCCFKLQACGWWGSAEYLYLWRKARFFPPLVTTNPTAAPVLSDPDTTILFGNESIGGRPKSGARGDFGIWFTRCLGFGVGGFVLAQEKKGFHLQGNEFGDPIFGQPFFNTATGLQDVHLLSFPLLQHNGSIEIETKNRLWGFDFYARRRMVACGHFSFDLLGGFLYNTIQDNLEVISQTTAPLFLRTDRITDSFSCSNTYYAGFVGALGDLRKGKLAVQVRGNVGFGNMCKQTHISGTTITQTLPGPRITVNSGLLAQPSNIGEHKKTTFAISPQVTASLQFRMYPHIWLTAGYTYMYWQSVALSGEQVNLDINPTQVPGPIVGEPSPFFHERLTSFWVQGLNAGLYFCY